MKRMVWLACAVYLLAGHFRPALAVGVQVLPGEKISAAAARYVTKTMGVPGGQIRSVYQVPDRTLPAGPIALMPHWPDHRLPVVNQSGRFVVPVTITVNHRRVNDVAVMVEIERPQATGAVNLVPGAFAPSALQQKLVRRGDVVIVSLTSAGGGVHIEMEGTAQGDGNAGEMVAVQLNNPWRMVQAKVVSPREVTIDPAP